MAMTVEALVLTGTEITMDVMTEASILTGTGTGRDTIAEASVLTENAMDIIVDHKICIIIIGFY